jgi:hypothetical protein
MPGDPMSVSLQPLGSVVGVSATLVNVPVASDELWALTIRPAETLVGIDENASGSNNSIQFEPSLE